MSEIKHIKTLYQTAFPADERRHFGDLEKLFAAENEMRIKIEYIGSELLGFIIYWEFEDFVYIEHFAVNKQFRGNGYGREMFQKKLQNTQKTVILEVEPPKSETAEKRIWFYERLGMILNRFPYTQPSYSAGKSPVDMLIMSSKNINEKEFEKIKNVIFEKVYFKTIV